jgi:hypothetical protein
MNIITIPEGRSPWSARLNNKRKGTRSTTKFRRPDQHLPNRSVGESETRISLGKPEKRFKFQFNKGKHFKPAGGSMRNKAARVSQHRNYVRPAVYWNQITAAILDTKPSPLMANESPDGPPTTRHFGVFSILDRIRSMPLE